MQPIIEFRCPPSEDLKVRICEIYSQVFSIVEKKVGFNPLKKTKARFIVDTVPNIQATKSKFMEIHGGKCPYDEFSGEVRIWSFPLICIEGHDILDIDNQVNYENGTIKPKTHRSNYVLSSAGVLCWMLPHEFTEFYLKEYLLDLAPSHSTRWLQEGLGNYASFQVTTILQPILHVLMADYYHELLTQRTEANLIKDWPEDVSQEEFYYGASTLFFLHAAAMGGPEVIPSLVRTMVSEKQGAQEYLWRFTTRMFHMSCTEAGEFWWTSEMVSRLLDV